MSVKSDEALAKQRQLVESVEAMENAMPLLVRMAETSAAVKRANFLALVKEGFSETQALELCKAAI